LFAMVASRASADVGEPGDGASNDWLDALTRHYLDPATGFGGLPIAAGRSPAGLATLVSSRRVELHRTSGRRPASRAFPALELSAQLEDLERFQRGDAAVSRLTAFPSPQHLATVVENQRFAPYAGRLACGNGELDVVYFDASVLDSYGADGRRDVEFSRPYGTVTDADNDTVVEFGTALDARCQEALAGFLGELGRLHGDEQQRWAAFELDRDFRVHPAYFEHAVLGEYVDDRPMSAGIVGELEQLSVMSRTANLPSLVRRTAPRPTETPLEFLRRPTTRSLHGFCITLDRLMGRNLNREFFAAVVPQLRDISRSRLTRLSSAELLELWMTRLRFGDPRPVDAMLTTVARVEELAQGPGWEDTSAARLEIYELQKRLMVEAFAALRTMRKILATHPALTGYDGVPTWLAEGRVYCYEHDVL
ncbi:MAG: hypothetical protein M3P40_12750, partial [Actinomycetota bacterium]|nr:hypothetical protein [Actinomycetota bacterium]